MPYILILIFVLILSPFVLSIASSQKKEVKQNLKITFLILLATQLVLGFFNWENFSSGRSGFELALIYPDSIVGLFFIISILQIIFLVIGKSFNTAAVILNFINSILIFIGMIKLSSFLGFQAVSFTSIGVVFIVLIGNVIALAWINKDKNLLKKYPFLK